MRHQGGEKGSHQTSIGDIARGDEDEDDEVNDDEDDVDVAQKSPFFPILFGPFWRKVSKNHFLGTIFKIVAF